MYVLFCHTRSSFFLTLSHTRVCFSVAGVISVGGDGRVLDRSLRRDVPYRNRHAQLDLAQVSQGIGV